MAVLCSKSVENRWDVSVIFRGKVTLKRLFISRFLLKKEWNLRLLAMLPKIAEIKSQRVVRKSHLIFRKLLIIFPVSNPFFSNLI